MTLVVCSPNTNSNALKLLAAELSAQLGKRVWRVTPENVKGRPAAHFRAGIDKVTQFNAFKAAGVSIPQFCTTLGEVKNLDCKEVVIRHKIASQEGAGIQIVLKEECKVEAPLYTAYIPKKRELRVHVWDGKAFWVQEKKKRDGVESNQVRNTANGYVFSIQGIEPPAGAMDLGVSAVKALGRTAGAVDIIYNEQRNQCYVLEVNSRPGMEGTTVKKYAEVILASQG